MTLKSLSGEITAGDHPPVESLAKSFNLPMPMYGHCDFVFLRGLGPRFNLKRKQAPAMGGNDDGPHSSIP
jgi:hypothetical protein